MQHYKQIFAGTGGGDVAFAALAEVGGFEVI